jgi:hypothetical protein
MTSVIRHFTFGQSHMCNHPEARGLLADHWVSVELPRDHPRSHREVFIAQFTSRYCPRPEQFAFEYPDRMLDPQHFPRGQLALIQELNNEV